VRLEIRPERAAGTYGAVSPVGSQRVQTGRESRCVISGVFLGSKRIEISRVACFSANYGGRCALEPLLRAVSIRAPDVEGVAVVSAQDVLAYDRQGHLAWAHDGMRAWVAQLAGPPALEDTETAR